MLSGDVEIQGSIRKKPIRMKLGFADDEFGYAISLGLPKPSPSAFSLDPEIKNETMWVGDSYRPASSVIEREGRVIKVRAGRQWNIVAGSANLFESMFSQVSNPMERPDMFSLRESIRRWRFYDYFRTDKEAPGPAIAYWNTNSNSESRWQRPCRRTADDIRNGGWQCAQRSGRERISRSKARHFFSG